jgi:hypothetical protein
VSEIPKSPPGLLDGLTHAADLLPYKDTESHRPNFPLGEAPAAGDTAGRGAAGAGPGAAESPGAAATERPRSGGAPEPRGTGQGRGRGRRCGASGRGRDWARGRVWGGAVGGDSNGAGLRGISGTSGRGFLLSQALGLKPWRWASFGCRSRMRRQLSCGI